MVSIASALGVGSGIDTVKLVSDLADASRQPKVAALDARASANKARISAVAQARADLESFSTSFTTLVAGGTLQTQPSVSDPNAISATAISGARIGTLSAEIDVTQLAKSQSIYSGYVASADTAVGQGGLTLSVGGTDYAIAINATNDSLTGLAAAINASGSGVSANIIHDSAGARIVLKGATGQAGAFTLTPDVGSDPGLASFAYPGGSGGMTLAQSAQNAEFTVDGVAYSRTTNSFTDVIPGVALTLKKAAPGVPVSIGSTRPSDTLKQTLQDFISVFNTLKKDLSDARKATGGDQALRALEQQLSGLISRTVTGDSEVNSLTDIGVSTNRDGTIGLDIAKFDAALAAHPDAVEALFSPTRDATHTAVTDPGLSGVLANLKDTATATGGMLSSLNSRLEKEKDSIAAARDRMEVRETAYKDRLNRQFGGMDARVAALKATQSYLEQQIKLWSNSSN